MLNGLQWRWRAAGGVLSAGAVRIPMAIASVFWSGARGCGLRRMSARVSRVGLAGAMRLLWVLLAAASSGSLAEEAAGRQTAAEVARAAANDDLDRLRREIRLLTELRDTQEKLREWNDRRAASGEPRAVLDAELCARMKQWCAVLPGTFGKDAARGVRP